MILRRLAGALRPAGFLVPSVVLPLVVGEAFRDDDTRTSSTSLSGPDDNDILHFPLRSSSSWAA